MKLLDLFCGAGGAGMGYHRAGFEVVGVDIAPQKHYPFEFHEADAFDYLRDHGHLFDVIHASPPCQAYTACKTMHTMRGKSYPKLVGPLRTAFLNIQIPIPWVIENVYGSPLHNPIMLCGLVFGLKVFRHRYFESPLLLFSPEHPNHNGHRVGVGGFVCMAGHGDSGRGKIPANHRTKASWEDASGINWMTRGELSQAIPPAYCEFIGKQLISYLRGRYDGPAGDVLRGT